MMTILARLPSAWALGNENTEHFQSGVEYLFDVCKDVKHMYQALGLYLDNKPVLL